MTLPFRQVDVFAGGAFLGNPVAVILDADDLSTAEMQVIARWTNLSETTFVRTPVDPSADYAVRIFTPGGELPFAGHPTLGTAASVVDHRGIELGALGRPLVQECGVGLVPVHRAGDGLAFSAPPLRRTGPVEPDDLHGIVAALRIDPGAVLDAEWVDNGPGWVGLLLGSADAVLSLRPDLTEMGVPVGVIGAYPAGGPVAFEVRAFVPGLGVPEDPVTGSLNASLAQWLLRTGRAVAPYTVGQGGAIGRNGLVSVSTDGGDVMIGGVCAIRVRGTIDPGPRGASAP